MFRDKMTKLAVCLPYLVVFVAFVSICYCSAEMWIVFHSVLHSRDAQSFPIAEELDYVYDDSVWECESVTRYQSSEKEIVKTEIVLVRKNKTK